MAGDGAAGDGAGRFFLDALLGTFIEKGEEGALHPLGEVHPPPKSSDAARFAAALAAACALAKGELCCEEGSAEAAAGLVSRSNAWKREVWRMRECESACPWLASLSGLSRRAHLDAKGQPHLCERLKLLRSCLARVDVWMALLGALPIRGLQLCRSGAGPYSKHRVGIRATTPHGDDR